MRVIQFTITIVLAVMSFFGEAQVTIYSADFDADTESWTNDGANNWVRGTATTNFATGADGSYMGYPNTGATHGSDETATFTSPVIDLSLYESLTFQVDIRYETEDTYDGFNIEYSSDGGVSWTVLGANGDGTNWYNDTDVAALDALVANEDGWSGDNTAWQTASLSLPATLEVNCEAVFRVQFASDGSVTEVGVAFDNVLITGSAVVLDAPVSAAVPGDASQSLVLWMRADSAVVVDSGGSTVSLWGDWTDNARIAINSGCTEPTYTTDAVNGFPAITFDGADDYLDLGDILDIRGVEDEWAVFSVFNTAGTGTIIARGSASTDRQYQIGVEGGGYFSRVGSGSANAGGAINSDWHIGSTVINTSNLNTFLDGGAQVLSGGIGSVSETENVIIGARTGGSGWFFNGDIAEIAMYYGSMTSATRRDIETYLAIKYAISLDLSSEDYTLDGTAIFDASDITGYQNDIAAVGRDDSQNLTQNLSISATGAALEISNASGLDDGDFLFWGNDAGVTTTTTSDVPGSIDNRVTRIWRVSETNDVGTVDLSFDLTTLGLPIRTFNLLTASSGSTMPAGLSSASISAVGTSSIVDGRDIITFTGITLNDQEYFTLGVSDATAPGDVSASLALWLKADAGVTHASNSVSDWADQSGNANDATEVATDYPTFVENVVNGNPVVRFDGNATSLEGSFTNGDGDWTFFLVGIENGGGTNSTEAFFEFRADVGADRYWFAESRYASTTNFASTIAQGAPTIWRIDHSGSSANVFENGSSFEASYATATYGNATTGTFNYTLGDDDTGGNELTGDIGEILAFTTSTLTAAQKRDTETYLAIKYGISLDITTTGYTVGGVDVYNYATYTNDIAGIGRNDSQGLNQISSQSESGATVSMSNASSLNDGDYLIWAHDNASTALLASGNPSGVDNHVTRIWRMDETGDVGTVDISIDLSGLGLQSLGTYQLIVSTSTDLQTDGIVTTDPTLSGSTITFSGVSIGDGNYFTLGADDQAGPGSVSATLSLWLDAGTGLTLNGSNVSDWADQSGLGNHATQATADDQPEFVTNELNGNAMLNFDGSGDVLQGTAGLYTEEYFTVVLPSEIYNSGTSSGTILGFETGAFARLGLGPTSNAIADEVITHAAGDGAGYRSAFTSTTANLNQPVLINSRENVGGTGQVIIFNGASVSNTEVNTYVQYDDGAYDIGDEPEGTPAFPFNGQIGEIISYTGRLGDNDRRDVESYLAIKYGITLDIATEGYTVGGTDVYTDTDYYSDIAGIASDESSNLNQISSTSSNSGSIVRMENASNLEDGEYLLWGNNGSANTFKTTDVPTGNTDLFEKVWKIGEFGGDGVGTVSLIFDVTSLGIDLDNSTLNLVILGSAFDPTNEFDDSGVVNSSGVVTNVSGRDYVTFSGVDFTDGDYFTLTGDVQTTSPGGSGASLALWLRGDLGVTSSSSLVSSWSDQSGNGNDVSQGNATNQPTLIAGVMNFNEGIYFDGSDNIENVTGAYTQDYFIVVKPDVDIDNTNANGYVLGFETNAADGFYVGDQNIIGSDLFGQTQEANAYDAVATTASISNDNVVIINSRNNVSATAQEFYANGGSFTASTSGTFANISDNPIRLGDNFDGDNAFEGYIGEVLMFSVRLGDADRRDVESYLAIKYGVTLDITSDGYTSGGVDVYNYSTHASDIAGIGTLLDYGLDQEKSISVNDGVIVKMENPSDLDDDEYLVWGYDGTGSKTTPQSSELPGLYEERLPAEWRVDLTGTPGTVTVKMYVGGIDDFVDRSQTPSLYELLIDDDGVFSAITSSVAASTLVDDTLTFENVSFADGDYFTLSLASQPVVAGMSLWLKAGADVEEASSNAAEDTDLVQYWRDQSGNSNDFDQSVFARRATYNTTTVNGNPVLTFDDAFAFMSLATTNLNPRSMYVVYTDASSDANTTPFTNDDTDDGLGIGYGGTTTIFDATNTPADVSDNGASYANGTDIGDGTAQARPANYEVHSRVFNSNLSNSAALNYYIGNDRGTSGTSIGGDIGEIMVYTTAHTNAERRDVESYLAIKYGITLDISSLNYTYNSGSSVYSISSYSNDIAGIGSNSDFGLSQSTSTSVSSDAMVTISNPSSLNSGDFLIWGNDNTTTDSTMTELPSGVGARMTREWGVMETNDIGTVTVTFDLSGLQYSLKVASDFVLLVDNDNILSADLLNTYSAQSYSSSILTFSGVDFTSATHFGLGCTVDLIGDSDTDGVPDYFETANGTDSSDSDDPVSGGAGGSDVNAATGTNGDGISDALENLLIAGGAASPVSVFTDTDGDGISDYLEVANGTDPFDESSPTASGAGDSDGDGLPDALEILIDTEGGPTNPSLSTDTDSDGVPDYYEVINGSDPSDANDPFADGGSDDDGNSDGDNISDAMEQILEDGGAASPLTATTDTDGDGIPDYAEAQTYTDPFNSSSPIAINTSIRSLQADYVASGGTCVDLDGYQWVDVEDVSGNLVFSINPFGNNLGNTCWGVRVVNTVRESGGLYYLDRNWYIEPTTQPTNNVYVRLYSLDSESSALAIKANADFGTSATTADILSAMTIKKVTDDAELDPFTDGVGGTTYITPAVIDFASASADVFVLELNSFSTLDPELDGVTVLPVELSYFNAFAVDQGVKLNWETLSELNNDYFEIERSIDDKNFIKIGTVLGNGTSNESILYEFLDLSASVGTTYYRLRQVDFDGAFEYSKTVSATMLDGYYEKELVVYPNPITGDVFHIVIHGGSIESSARIEIYSLSGALISRQVTVNETAVNAMDINTKGLENGYYLINVVSGRSEYKSRIVINR